MEVWRSRRPNTREAALGGHAAPVRAAARSRGNKPHLCASDSRRSARTRRKGTCCSRRGSFPARGARTDRHEADGGVGVEEMRQRMLRPSFHRELDLVLPICTPARPANARQGAPRPLPPPPPESKKKTLPTPGVWGQVSYGERGTVAAARPRRTAACSSSRRSRCRGRWRWRGACRQTRRPRVRQGQGGGTRRAFSLSERGECEAALLSLPAEFVRRRDGSRCWQSMAVCVGMAWPREQAGCRHARGHEADTHKKVDRLGPLGLAPGSVGIQQHSQCRMPAKWH